ncbi:MAG: hypothetical protein NZ807_14415, partial [Dehalococcoidia bacterium]|nr:hypothetical protein [Dehalococcoidia bacterium]
MIKPAEVVHTVGIVADIRTPQQLPASGHYGTYDTILEIEPMVSMIERAEDYRGKEKLQNLRQLENELMKHADPEQRTGEAPQPYGSCTRTNVDCNRNLEVPLPFKTEKQRTIVLQDKDLPETVVDPDEAPTNDNEWPNAENNGQDLIDPPTDKPPLPDAADLAVCLYCTQQYRRWYHDQFHCGESPFCTQECFNKHTDSQEGWKEWKLGKAWKFLTPIAVTIVDMEKVVEPSGQGQRTLRRSGSLPMVGASIDLPEGDQETRSTDPCTHSAMQTLHTHEEYDGDFLNFHPRKEEEVTKNVLQEMRSVKGLERADLGSAQLNSGQCNFVCLATREIHLQAEGGDLHEIAKHERSLYYAMGIHKDEVIKLSILYDKSVKAFIPPPGCVITTMKIGTFVIENRKDCLEEIGRIPTEEIQQRARFIKGALWNNSPAVENRASDSSVRFTDLAKALCKANEHWAKDIYMLVGIIWKTMKKNVIVTNLWDRGKLQLLPWTIRAVSGCSTTVEHDFDWSFARFDKHMLPKFGDTALSFVNRKTLVKIVLSCIAPQSLTSKAKFKDTTTYLHLLQRGANGEAVLDYKKYQGLALQDKPEFLITINLREAMKSGVIIGISPEPMDGTRNARLVTRQPIVWTAIEQVIELLGTKGQSTKTIFDKRFKFLRLSEKFPEHNEKTQLNNWTFIPELTTAVDAEAFFTQLRANDCPTGSYWICPEKEHFGLASGEEVKNKKGFNECIICGKSVEWENMDQVKTLMQDGAISVEGRETQAVIKETWEKLRLSKNFGNQLADSQTQSAAASSMAPVVAEDDTADTAAVTDSTTKPTEAKKKKKKKNKGKETKETTETDACTDVTDTTSVQQKQDKKEQQKKKDNARRIEIKLMEYQTGWDNNPEKRKEYSRQGMTRTSNYTVTGPWDAEFADSQPPSYLPLYVEKFVRETKRFQRQHTGNVTRIYPRFIALGDNPEKVKAMSDEEHLAYRKEHSSNIIEYYAAIWEDIQSNLDPSQNLRSLHFTNLGWSEFETGPPGQVEMEVYEDWLKDPQDPKFTTKESGMLQGMAMRKLHLPDPTATLQHEIEDEMNEARKKRKAEKKDDEQDEYMADVESEKSEKGNDTSDDNGNDDDDTPDAPASGIAGVKHTTHVSISDDNSEEDVIYEYDSLSEENEVSNNENQCDATNTAENAQDADIPVVSTWQARMTKNIKSAHDFWSTAQKDIEKRARIEG